MIPDDRCECCGKYKAYRDGMCWGCRNEYQRHAADFAVEEDIGNINHEQIENKNEQ